MRLTTLLLLLPLTAASSARLARRRHHARILAQRDPGYWAVTSVWVPDPTPTPAVVNALAAEDDVLYTTTTMTVMMTVTQVDEVEAAETGLTLSVTSSSVTSTTASPTTASPTTTPSSTSTLLSTVSTTSLSPTSTDPSTPSTPVSANGKKVFAHFMVGVVSSYQPGDWEKDMRLAASYGIDGFALNIGTDPYTVPQLTMAYAAAQSVGFSVFISFDFNWFSPTSPTPVLTLLSQFAPHPASYRARNGASFVSSFAGDGFDWAGVKRDLRSQGKGEVFVVPNFQPSGGQVGEGVDGLFSWYAWPSVNNGPLDAAMTTLHDNDYLGVTSAVKKEYMAPVSPWFYTHFGKEVSYSKNWLFKSETLWYDRWQQILELQNQLEHLEIVTWNDYGESHYVGPYNTPHTDDGSSRWADSMPHSALLEFAVPYIKAFKTGSSTPVFDKDMLVYWHRPHLKSASCDGSDNCGSRPAGADIVQDTVFVTSFAKTAGVVTVTSGSNAAVAHNVPAGVTMLQVPMSVGKQSFSFKTVGGTDVGGQGGLDVTSGCWNGTIYNFNIYTGSFHA